MKVTGTSSVGSLGGAKGGARGGGGQGGFALPTVGGATAAPDVARSSGVGGIDSIGALLALQDVGGPLERRRRAVGRAGRILDVLDEVKIALIDGEVSRQDLDRLVRAVREERLSTDDGRLEGVLDEIETRAAVELAKLEYASAAI
ncbi:MAG: flagellar assembly protein FliX [Caulobacter sp.]|nr:flagellar assembly protein FliX [Caulobacter sp.]